MPRMSDTTIGCAATHLAENGYAIVPGALSAEQVDRLTAAVDGVWEKHGSPAADVQLFGLPELDRELVEPVALPSTLPLVCAALGCNIFLYHSHLDVNPPMPVQDSFSYYWHQDMASVTRGLPPPRPLLSVKVSYFLTDVSSPDCGNLRVIPGSHLREHVPLPADRTQEPCAAVAVLAPAGSAVVMDPRVWHARGPNRSGLTRKALFYAYAYRWIRSRDQLTLSEERLAGLSPVQRQLLGEGTGPESFHHPQEADIPLKGLAEQHSWPRGTLACR